MDNSILSKPILNIVQNDIRSQRLQYILKQQFNQIEETLLNQLLLKFKWKELKRGEVLCQEGETGDSLYLLVVGRLKAVVAVNTAQERQVGEIAQGESVGEMALITGEARTATIYAVRDCTLAQLFKSDFDDLVALFPAMALDFSKLIINRLTYAMHHIKVPAKLTNITLVPASSSQESAQFIEQLLLALSTEGKIKHIHQKLVPSAWWSAQKPADHVSFKLNYWLTEQDPDHDFAIFEADPENMEWTRQCLRQADKIIVLKEVKMGTELSEIEKVIFNDYGKQHSENIEIALLYPADTEMPLLTHTFLASCNVSRHYNIRLHDIRHVHRLARMVINKGVGLVLGGGGAKGFAHIGIFKAIREAGIPIDMVCGTSMGAIIAAAIAHEWNPDKLYKTGRSAFVKDKPLGDYTLPITSLLKGHKLQDINKKYFGEAHIEDVWLNFFCISSNYTLSEMVVHERGPLWKAVTASVSIPGVLPPVVEGNNLLIDGGSFNNFPVDVMKSGYGGKLIGINLLEDKEYQLNYTKLPSGWHLFLSRFLPFLKKYKSPSISAIMLKSTILSSIVHQRKQIQDLDIFMTPPVGKFSLLDLNKYDGITETGYTYGKSYLSSLDEGILKSLQTPALPSPN